MPSGAAARHRNPVVAQRVGQAVVGLKRQHGKIVAALGQALAVKERVETLLPNAAQVVASLVQ